MAAPAAASWHHKARSGRKNHSGDSSDPIATRDADVKAAGSCLLLAVGLAVDGGFIVLPPFPSKPKACPRTTFGRRVSAGVMEANAIARSRTVGRVRWTWIATIAAVGRFARRQRCSAQAAIAGKSGEAPRFQTDRQAYPQSIRTRKAKLTLIDVGTKCGFYKEKHYLSLAAWGNQTR